ncbi:right-handed parallel beta-helix repeat-containing protein [Sphingomonas cavernae]|uniref:Right-handed parallel beta-helix repeat-containing protein n=1 Tax=Sphingomonas cavernae TaxID=2320861 RepID=A0A418WLS9_9SPHN|nr:right-handed parallel beta-helix repeat-containing protein [Sphingomonas cavernae]RJF90869.1 right-handed parallel beta-helix repeat-containing protein [Sphingomonas cavernae]
MSLIDESRARAVPDIGKFPPSGLFMHAKNVRETGAKLDGGTDDSIPLTRALETTGAAFFEGEMFINSVVRLPNQSCLLGTGVWQSRLILGPNGKILAEGDGWDKWLTGISIRNLTIAMQDAIKSVREPGLDLRKVEHVLIENVNLYHLRTSIDNHHNIVFNNVRFFGGIHGSALLSQCSFQPSGGHFINSSPLFEACFSSGHPFYFEDTVETTFSNCKIFAGSCGISSRRHRALGTTDEPFLMGPVIIGCTLDSIDGAGIQIDGGGTNCRLIGNFISAGRKGGRPGLACSNSHGVEIIGNHFEWCGKSAIQLVGSSEIIISGNTFANQLNGNGITANKSTSIKVTSNSFFNRGLWGGSRGGATEMAISTPASDADGWIVTGNSASGMREDAVAIVRGTATRGRNIVRDNIGFPWSTEQGWPAGATSERPANVRDGFLWYDTDVERTLMWNADGKHWQDTSGKIV